MSAESPQGNLVDYERVACMLGHGGFHLALVVPHGRSVANRAAQPNGIAPEQDAADIAGPAPNQNGVDAA